MKKDTSGLSAFKKAASKLESTSSMPAMFVGHGNPMNAIEKNEFTNGWTEAAKKIPAPQAVLCISAHWLTEGKTLVTAMEKPKTIHDFYGFPKELYEVSYPAPGDKKLAIQTQKQVTHTKVGLDNEWGLDHGCWSVLKHMFPKANVPIVQMSIDLTKDAKWHYELAKELSALRERGVLIVGSGNMVHNLGMMAWNVKGGFQWANEANETMKSLILKDEHDKLIKYGSLGREVQLAVPTPDHYYPLLYALGLKGKKESVSFFNDKNVLGSVSMTSLTIND